MSTFYMFCFLLSFLLSLMYVYKWNDHFNEHITLLFMIIPLGNYGHWEFSVAKSVEQAALGIKMTYIGDVPHISDLIAKMPEQLAEHIISHSGTGMAKMSLPIDGRTADIHTHVAGVNGLEKLLCTA